ncbi:ABC transporter substrate-binding protein [Seleniivibrio woodruffii]|uniref:Amino acid/amide ABC transporter substrate-binding protein (HAAT family) n=1 Tax=Seleniivibrio woodruffii TaxID=1078050 RepID=A0A4R1KCV6_9BACT|nr:ABC transporter substrate-binding protein [Seleniivibrio woodruffii]TCK61880.1 amino acid/amide ABC transporter substrate-binding protein (HAAT family) [Seleniivibrio woodruffii]TVZ35005.1 amino acid/amide ABC transporter substrate-binding protein (HAAT family) [Seleniivibrio woodruffii]
MYTKYVFLLIFVLISAAGCSRGNEKIDVGFIGTLSGRYSDIGQDALKGIMLAMSDLNMENDINLIIHDDMGVPADGVSALSRLSEKKVKYVLGPSISAVAEGIVPLLNKSKLYMFSPTVSTTDLAGKDDRFFRLLPHNNIKQTDGISEYLVKKLSIKDMVIIYDARNSAYSTDIVKNMTASFTRAGGTVRDIRALNPESGESMQALISPDRDNPPQMYYLITSSLDSALLIWQIKKAGYPSKLSVRAWAASNEFFRLGGQAIEGAYIFDYYIDSGSPAYKDFRKRYIERFTTEPTWMSVHGYDSGMIFFSGFKSIEKGTTFKEAIIRNTDKVRILKGAEIDEYGDAHLPLHAYIIRSGRIVRLGTSQ